MQLENQIGISRSRADWIHGWVEQTLETGSVEVADFNAVLGRMGFTVGALDYHCGGNNYSFDALQAYRFGINLKL